jgi:6-phosphogluconate dehydrogenase
MSSPRMAMIGMAVMGSNFAQNFADNGFDIAMYNRTDARTQEAYDAIPDSAPHKQRMHPVIGDLRKLVDVVGADGTYFVMVQAGATQSVLDELVPMLTTDAVVVNCANENWRITETMAADLEGKVDFFGMGVSGGEEGARRGPSMMPGGPSQEVYDARLSEALDAVAAKAGNGEPCVTYIGKRGAGHFVKMVHNGIEYGDMELIAEAYDLMRKGLGMSAQEIGDVFARWNEGVLKSYLIEISAEVLHQPDAQAEGSLVDYILDRARMKGTGTWTIQNSLDFDSGVYPVPTIYAAVETRAISSMRDQRVAMSATIPSPHRPIEGDRDAFIADLETALFVSKISSYTQGIGLIQEAAKEYDFGGLDIAEIARIWRAGCIIRAQFLDDITEAYRAEPDLLNLMAAPLFRDAVANGLDSLERVCVAATQARVPAMAFDASKNFVLQLVSDELPTNLTQAQRDNFGAHTYERTDCSGSFHTHWQVSGKPETEVD